MKKAFMLVAAIAMITAPVFAIDAEVSGNVTATFGVNLGSKTDSADATDATMGFENASDIEIILPLIGADSSSAIEGEGMYGEITVEDFGLQIKNGAFDTAFDDDEDDSMTGTITGKVHFGDLFLGVYSAPDVDANFAENFGYSSAAAAKAAFSGYTSTTAADLVTLTAAQGTYVAAASGAAAIAAYNALVIAQAAYDASVAADAAATAAGALATREAQDANTVDYNNDILNLGATGGMSFGFDNGDHEIELSLSSVGTWEQAASSAVTAVSADWTREATSAAAAGTSAATTRDSIVVGLTADSEFGDLEVEAAFLYANKYWSDLSSSGDHLAYVGFGVKPTYTLTLEEDVMDIEISVGFDGVSVPKDAMADVMTFSKDGFYYDIAPEVTFNITAENEDEDRANVMVGAYFSDNTSEYQTELKDNDAANAVMNLQVVFAEPTDLGLMDGLGAEVSFQVLNLLDALEDQTTADDEFTAYAFDLSVDYEVIPGLTPSIAFGMGTNDYNTSLGLGVEAGSDLHGIANTTFNVDWASTSLSSNDDNGKFKDSGILTISTEISF